MAGASLRFSRLVCLVFSAIFVGNPGAYGVLMLEFGFNEGAGPTVNDLSGNGNNGTVFGAAWEPQGFSGSALSFDGLNDYVEAPDNPSLDMTAALTISA